MTRYFWICRTSRWRTYGAGDEITEAGPEICERMATLYPAYVRVDRPAPHAHESPKAAAPKAPRKAKKEVN